MADTSRVAFLRKAADQLYSASGRLPVVLGTSTALGSVGTFVDATRLVYADADVDFLNGVWVRIDEAVGGGPASGAFSRVRKAGLAPAIGTLTVSPDFSAAIQSGTDYSLHLLHPLVLEKGLDWALAKIRYRALLVLSHLPDGDMEDAGVTNWPVVGAAVASKIASTFEIGRQMLDVNNGAAGDGVRSNSLLVTPDEPLRFASLVETASGPGTLDVELFNVTAGAVWKTINVRQPQAVEVRVSENVPAGCRQMRVRYLSKTDQCDFRIVYSSLMFPNRDRLQVPRADFKRDLIGVRYLPSGPAAGDPDTYLRLSERMEEIGFEADGDARAGQPITITVNALDAPLFVDMWRRYPALTGDADTTRADEEEVLAGVRVYLRARMADGSIVDAEPSLVSILKAMEEQDREIWNRATARADGQRTIRMKGLRKVAI